MNPKKLTIPLLIALVALIYVPVFHWLVESWLSNPYYSHGFLIPLVAGFFMWTNRHALDRSNQSSSGAVILSLGILVYVIGFSWGMRYVTALSLLFIVSGFVVQLWGAKGLWSMAFPVGILIFMIPLPILDDVSYELQSISAHYSTWLLETIRIPIITDGADITLEGSTFTIGLPCSGMNTLIALLALGAIYAFVVKGPTYKRVMLFVATLPIAILANIFRISSIILVAYYYNVEFATGLYHDLSSLIFYMIAFGLLLLLGWLIGCRLRAAHSAEPRET